jgi:hypothetical protein
MRIVLHHSTSGSFEALEFLMDREDCGGTGSIIGPGKHRSKRRKEAVKAKEFGKRFDCGDVSQVRGWRRAEGSQKRRLINVFS